mgnify:CR=1 FL=1
MILMMTKATQLYTNLYNILFTIAISLGNPLHALLYIKKIKSQCSFRAKILTEISGKH